jgi:hypothetical protein
MPSFRKSGLFRTAILIAAVLALLGVAMASTSPAHFHERAGGRCDICATAHVVSLEAQTVFHFVGSVAVCDRLAPPAAASAYQLLLDSASSSRGPPSLA